MIIHTVSCGDTVFSIARKYAVSPVKIIENNALLYPDRLTVGQKLLILTPTKTYFVRGGDTAAKICRRFGIRKNALLAANPALHGKQHLRAGSELVLKYDQPQFGAAAMNGYIYENTSMDRFYTLLPYLTYLTFCCLGREAEQMLNIANAEQKISLLRLRFSDLWEKRKENGAPLAPMAQRIKNMGFKGIVISQPPRDITPSEREAFIFDIKKDLLGMDMLLFCEAEGEGHDQNHDAADAVIVFYEKCNRSEIPSFENGERQVYERYAEGNDSGKAFIELSSFGYDGEKPLTIEQIQKIAIKYGAEFKNDEEKGISILSYNQYKNGKGRKASICFENLDNTKSKLALMHELGFMGAAFDVGRVPISFLMMLYTTFTGIEYGLSEAFDF